MFFRPAITRQVTPGLILVGSLFGIACARPPVAPSPAPVPRAAPAVTPAPPVDRNSPSATPAASPPPVDRAPLPDANPKLPPVPLVTGKLDINVVYPPRNAIIASRDSNLIFGSVGNGTAGLRINGDLVPVWPDGAFMGWVPNPSANAQWYDMVAYTQSDTVRLRYPTRTRAAVGNPPSAGPRVTRFRNPVAAILDDPSLDRAVSDTDNFIIGRPTPGGDYNWFLLPGTTVRVLEYRGSMARIELDAGRRIWVNRRDVKVRRGRSTKRLTVSRATVSSHRATVDLELRISSPPAYKVVEDTDGMTLVLYNTRSSAKLASPHDSLIDVITQSVTTHRATYHIELTRPLYGYQVLYHKGVFRLEIRRPPVVNRSEPLRGMTIVVDPGHPPIGATGPTGLWEPVPTLAVGLRVQRLLEARGAHVVMTRANADPVALELRPIMARRANANAFVSIHLNAVGDGQNPFRANGTGTYYFHPQSKAYARLVQDALVPELGLRDRGVFYQNLAVCRPTWFPAVLAEGLFIIMPDQEAAIKTPEYQEAYARGIVDGLERYFATFAR